jgi:hypothetical protein
MNDHGPPKRERRLGQTALRKLELHGAYHVAALLTTILGRIFWFWAQRRGRLQDRIANEEGEQ